MQKILVTGGAGYIGSVMVPELLNHGFAVTVIDELIFNQDPLPACKGKPHFQLVEGDVRSQKTIEPLLKKVDIVIPLAALVGAPLCDQDPARAVATNQEAIRVMVKNLSEDQKILIPTTNSGYGIGDKGKMCTEDSPMRPLSLYARTKVEAERAVLSRKNSISFRLATVFGPSPRMRIDLLVNDFTYRAVTKGKIEIFEGHFKRNYIHIRDVVRVFLQGIEKFDEMKGEVFNVGLSDANLSKLELCETIKKHVPGFQLSESATGKDPDQRDYIVSNEKIEKTGFKPHFSLDDGIRELIECYQKNTYPVSANV